MFTFFRNKGLQVNAKIPHAQKIMEKNNFRKMGKNDVGGSAICPSSLPAAFSRFRLQVVIPPPGSKLKPGYNLYEFDRPADDPAACVFDVQGFPSIEDAETAAFVAALVGAFAGPDPVPLFVFLRPFEFYLAEALASC